MANGKILRQLIKAGTNGDVSAFRHISKAVIQEERQKQHHLLANDLEQILYRQQSSTVRNSKEKITLKAPVDKEKGLPLLDIKLCQRPVDELILSASGLASIEETLEEHRRADVLRSHGLQPVGKVIFCGPPGCGKTMAAEVIAFELDRPLAIVRLDALVSSFLGETATNLRKIFEFIAQHELVVLFDEFDAIGKSRSDTTDHGELRRVVNAVLQMMDAYQGNSLLLAATNYEQTLDTAIWRRFDEAINFPLPEATETEKILTLKLRGVRRQFEVSDKPVIQLFAKRSGAEVERIIRRAIKQMILRRQEFLTLNMLEQAVSRENR